MSSDIILSAGVRQNLLSLQDTASLMQQTQQRLATGKKVNSALDNPISFFTSQSLQNRAGQLNSLLDSMSNGIQTIQAANNGITSITSTVQSMQSTLNQALQDNSWQGASYTINSAAIGTASLKNLTFSGGSVTGSVNVALNSTGASGTQSTLSTTSSYLAPSAAAASSTESGTYDGLSGAATYSFKVNGQDINLTSASTGTNSGDTLAHAKASIQAQLDARFGSGTFTVGSNTAGDGFKITGKADGTNDVTVSNQAGTGAAAHQATEAGAAYTGLGAGETYTFKVNGNATAITLDSTTGDTAAHAQASVQSQLDSIFGAGNFTATVNGSTGLTITGKADGSNDVSISNQAAAGGSATTAGLGFGTTTVTDTGTLDQTVAGLGLGSSTTTSYGTPADSYDFTVNGTSVSIAAGTGLASAVSSVTSQLSGTGFEAFDNSGKLGIREVTAQGASLTIGGTDATSLFGATLTNTGTATTTAGVNTVDELVNAINGNSSLTGKVKASNDNGSLRITNLSTSDLSVQGASSTAVDGSGTTQTITGNTVRKGLVAQFNQLRDQLDKLAGDASYNGVDLLSGDNLKLTLNETGTSSINVQTKDANGNVLTINSTNLGISSAANSDFNSNTTINSLLDTLTTALSTLDSQSSALGSNLSAVQTRQDFTKNMINTLQTGADNLVLADTNQEGANMLALQTRQSLSTTALSLANQASQAVLRLFG